MSERRRNTHRISFIKPIALLGVLCVAISATGCNFYVADRIADYDYFLGNYTKYSVCYPEPMPVQPEIKVPEIEGFLPIANTYFDYGKPFGCELTFVKLDGKNYLLDTEGNLTETANDLTQYNIDGGKYFTEKDGKIGLCDILGNVLLSNNYTQIEIIGNSWLTKNGNISETYFNGIKVADKVTDTEVSLYEDGYLLIDENIYGLDFVPKQVAGFEYISSPHDNIVVVNLGNGTLGYVNLTTETQIGGEYIWAEDFAEGVGVAKDLEGASLVIDKSGNILYSSKTKTLLSKAGKYQCYVTHNMFGVLDNSFNDITDAIFPSIKNSQAYDDYIIVCKDARERLYLLTERKFVSDEFFSIDYKDGLFMFYNGNNTIITDNELKVIAECDEANYSNGILELKTNGKYTYYKRSNESDAERA